MPRILDETEVDSLTVSLDQELTAAEEADAFNRVMVSREAGDLTDGGQVGGVKLRPMAGGRNLEKGRAAARRAWRWDGAESLLPLAWDPEGKHHDYAMRYFRKRHCTCCGASGFVGPCRACVNANCPYCAGGSQPKKIIPCYYQKYEDVPYPTKCFGDIPCFHPLCTRRDAKGFKTEEDMRMHARTRHRMEYAAHMETLTANRADEVGMLRNQVQSMSAAMMQMIGNGNGIPRREATPDSNSPIQVEEEVHVPKRGGNPGWQEGTCSECGQYRKVQGKERPRCVYCRSGAGMFGRKPKKPNDNPLESNEGVE